MADHTAWPSLRVESWAETRDIPHMWMQIIGNIRMVETPLINHWWNVTFVVTPGVSPPARCLTADARSMLKQRTFSGHGPSRPTQVFQLWRAEAYSRECASAGFWPDGGQEGAFYAYCYPTPDG